MGRYLLLVALFLPGSLLCQTPASPQAALIQDGKTVYAGSCSGCHGADTFGTDHAPKLTGNSDVRRRSVEQLRNLISSGIPAGGMPAFASLPPQQLDAIAAFIHSLNSPASQTIVPGDAALGGQFFWGQGKCGSCHMVHGRGSSEGPDLSDAGSRMTADEIHTALVHPDQHITTGYELVTVVLRNGKTLRGFARGRTNFGLQLQDLDGDFHLLQSTDIVSVAEDSDSLMPPVNGSPEQVQNLSAYLSQLAGINPGSLPAPNAHTSQPQDVEFSRILNPRPGDWPTYNGKLEGNRYSGLKQINASNVKDLALKWIFPMPHFGLESTPIVINGVMYVSGNNQAYAIDALSGEQIWKYSRPSTPGLVGDASLGTNRGVAILGDKIFMVTDNAHLLALNRVTGSLVWDVVMPEQPEHYGSTVSPLVINDTVIAGVSGGDWGMRGFLACYKAATGELVWRHWTLPAKAGDPGIDTWGKKPPLLAGGSTWLTGTYDKETDTLYWPTGNPWPDRDDRDRPGDNLFTDCILALNPRTGETKWYFQFTPHDTADRDAAEPPVLVDTEYRGKPRKLLLHADRNGFFYVLDRTNGELLLAKTFLHRVNWATGIGPDGRPQLAVLPTTASNREKTCPDNAANWSSTAFSQTTRLYYLMTLEDCHEIETSQKASEHAVKPGERYMRAINIDTGNVAWEIPQTGPVILKTWSGVLATAGGLVFYGDPNGAFVAIDEREGKKLWHFDTNVGMKASPMTYLVDGKQFVAVAAGSAFLSFALPSP
jgi:PQQ-dependent dehydrogenase (methanol/ethanol family)